jgi:hypothetical protein
MLAGFIGTVVFPHDISLIAAAPEMFDALRKIPQRYLDDMDAHTPRAAQLIRAALTKARGES